MKKPNLLVSLLLIFAMISGVVLFTILAGGINFESIFVGIIALLFLAYALPQLLTTKKGGIYNDEYTKKSIQVAASRSFYVSLYMWFILLWFGDLFSNSAFQIAFGIGLMTIIFIINAFIIKFTGLKQ